MARGAMPLHWGDYLADTQHLSASQHGMYLLLIGHYWTTGSIPSEPMHLQYISRCKNFEEFQKDWSVVQNFFHFEAGKWVHTRVELELKKATQIKEVRAAAADRRWASGGGMQKHMQSRCSEKAADSSSKDKLSKAKDLTNLSSGRGVGKPSPAFDWVRHKWVDVEPLLAVWKDAYPLVDVEAELKTARAWVVSNPSKAKKDWGRFLNGWMARAGGKQHEPRVDPRPSADPYEGVAL